MLRRLLLGHLWDLRLYVHWSGSLYWGRGGLRLGNDLGCFLSRSDRCSELVVTIEEVQFLGGLLAEDTFGGRSYILEGRGGAELIS